MWSVDIMSKLWTEMHHMSFSFLLIATRTDLVKHHQYQLVLFVERIGSSMRSKT